MSLKSNDKERKEKTNTLSFYNTSLPVNERIKGLISKLSLEEKVSLMMHESPAIERLGIPEYNWWNECLHGVARSGPATIFPQPIGLGSTFDTDLIYKISTAISDEARAIFNAAVAKNNRLRYAGLTFWTPNINIFRDPRWGRGMETYGEDPFLTSRIGVSFVKGLQGDHPYYLKASACGKHYVVHSGPEELRHEFNAIATQKDIHETYFPAFEAIVKEANVESIMCAYNRTNDEPCCGSNYLINKVLREQWGFKGFVVSDGWGIIDLHEGHKVTKTPEESAALALKSGINLNCGSTYDPYLIKAVKKGLVSEKEIDKNLFTHLRTRFKLGLFDRDDNNNPYNSISTKVINSSKHRALSRKAAQKSIVLLKNKNNVLPLAKDTKSLYVLGPNASNLEVLLGNYYGINGRMVTILEGLAAKVKPGSQIQYRKGFLLDRDNINPIDWTSSDAKYADASIIVMGLSPILEGEEGEAIASPYKGDRIDYNLPKNQIDFLKLMRKDNHKPIIAVITGGSPMNLSEVHEIADAVVLVWYPGEEGGNAVGDIIFGDAVPSGRLPITFPKTLEHLPSFEDYSMANRTYRYTTKKPMYPFGFGLSYTSYKYKKISVNNKVIKKGNSAKITVNVENTGKRAGEEIVQLYLVLPDKGYQNPLYSLKGFKKTKLQPGESKNVKFEISPEMMASVNPAGEKIIEEGNYIITAGGASPGERSIELGMPEFVKTSFTVSKQ